MKNVDVMKNLKKYYIVIILVIVIIVVGVWIFSSGGVKSVSPREKVLTESSRRFVEDYWIHVVNTLNNSGMDKCYITLEKLELSGYIEDPETKNTEEGQKLKCILYNYSSDDFEFSERCDDNNIPYCVQ